MTITFKNGGFTFKTYQKSMNLYLYIPSHSAHTPGLLKSLIYGLVFTYHRQNTFKLDFLHFIRLLYDRLIARGHKKETLYSIFLCAAESLEKKLSTRKTVLSNNKKSETKSTNNRLFFHLPFHPKDVSRQQIRNIYKNTCKTPDKNGNSFKLFKTDRGSRFVVNRMTIAYHRPKNLRDLLSPSKLKETSTLNVNSAPQEFTKAQGNNHD